jgi:hypothetical protein
MAVNPWKCPNDILELIHSVQIKNHQPRLALASVAACFDDSKPFVHNKLNLGKVAKFSPFMRLWQDKQHDFCLVIPSDLWVSVLNSEQREAYLDLQLTRCEVEYEPDFAEVAGRGGKTKKVKIKDEWGRIQYSDRMRYDDVTGEPKWKVLPLDLEVFTRNVRRYGLWLDELMEFKNAIERGPRLPQPDAVV